ncbi:hypothetical protein W97_00778 [Coniosporium apollinis CBS 100218]|uniref:Major facilitator superfamily (MFS) profile domain-containing protein n=1 Tax=Coniosporium apollinis (strain CBS 100218) TaxID=1168221 RepID=R7YI52_CONA1|nr:uncharacterized protein W97_00778 [Coniosporium apollinis CBS 100218]EON61563.1 hypothetical protein W97_00778 [Coniosporium apollinis CBS 100218]
MPNLRHASRWLFSEFGLKTLASSGRDTYIILLLRFLRMFAYGSAALILALYFAALGHSDEKIGLFMTLTLLGDVVISLFLTLVADKLGRRTTLLFGSCLMAGAGAVFALSGNYCVLLVAAILGVISPSGNEIGPFRAIEESTLAHLVEPEGRPDVFAWYVVLATLGSSGGLVVCGWVVHRLHARDYWTEVDAYRAVFWVYAILGAVNACLSLFLSRKCEVAAQRITSADATPAQNDENRPLLQDGNGSTADDGAANGKVKERKGFLSHISPETRSILLRLCALFFMDSLASGMVPYSLINYYMDRKFHMPKNKLGAIMSAAMFVSSISNIFAASISKRIGLIKTMVFTHLPSAIFLALIPAPKSLALTICLLVGRASLNSMDQAPRSAFLSAVVLPTERTAVMGIVNVVKTLSQSGGPLITGILAGWSRFWVAFVAAGALKASYDIGLLTFFVNTKLRHQGRSDDDPDVGGEPDDGCERSARGDDEAGVASSQNARLA